MTFDFTSQVMLECSTRFTDSKDLEFIRNSILKNLRDYDMVPKKTEITLPNMELNNRFLKMYDVSLRIDGKAQSTRRGYIRSAQQFLDIINKRCVDVTKNDVILYIATLQNTTTLSSKGVYVYFKEARQFWRWLFENEYITKNPFSKVHFVDRTEKPTSTLTVEEIVRMEDACKNNKLDLALIDFLVSTGLRVGEVRLLKRNDIDFNAGTVAVYAPKTKTYRTAFLTPSASMHLKDYLNSRTDDNDYLFVGKQKIRLSEDRIETRIREVAKAAGINKHVTVHTFRRTLATILHKKGMRDLDISAILGHADVDTTAKYYIKNDIGNLQNNFAKYMII